MTPSQQAGEVREFLDLLVDADIAVIRNQVFVSELPAQLRRVSWPSGIGFGLFEGTSFTLPDYRYWVDEGRYSAVLYDGSLLQISFEFRYGELIRHRLAYVPCPLDVSEYLDAGDSLSEVLYLLADVSPDEIRLRSPIRFDFDIEAGGEGHPASHLTVNAPSCRVPVVGPVSFGHFVKFVFRNFYAELWEVHGFIREWQERTGDRTISESQERRLHVAWRPAGA